MKRILCITLALLFLSSCTKHDMSVPNQNITNSEVEEENVEFRAVWISYLDLQKYDFGNEEKFTEEIKADFKYISDFGLNTVIVQVRPFADAVYLSNIFPWSNYVSENKPIFDPLSIMLDIAELFDLSFHAWVNPYRISNNSNYEKLDSDSPALKFIENKTSDVIISEKGIYFNPASLAAQKIIINGIRELIENYSVDAIHIDDYFYPTTSEAFDADSYKEYESSGGKLTLSDWRRENVNSLISGIYSVIKGYDKRVLFGISPGGNIGYNYNNLYADVKKWCSCSGYIDYIIPQLYFGFDNTTKPFCSTADEWAEITKGSDVDLYCGLALYKVGLVDEFCADDKSKNEWIDNDDIIKRQIEYIRQNKSFGGFSLYSLRNLSDSTDKNSKIELQNLRSVL